MPLVGRASEQAALQELLAGACAGRSGALVIRGEPGVGKTALVDDLVASATGLTVTRAAGIESEGELGFAGLHRILVPFRPHWDRLPAPQRDALAATFGLTVAAPPDKFLVGLATLTVLAEAAVRAPLLCVVEDTQWLDQESRELLAFVARRLLADRVAMVFTAREPGLPTGLEGLPQLPLGPLGADAARELLAVAVPEEIAADVEDRILEEAAGNALAIVELAAGLTAGQLAGRSVLPEVLPLSSRLEARFLQRVEDLPAPAQALLLVAAAEPTGDLGLLLGACAHLGLPVDAAHPAEEAGLLTLGPDVAFRHPLVRSAVYRGASLSARCQVHEALAATTDPEADPDRRAWHVAAATLAPDEDVAAQLEAAAERSRTRGGYASVASLLARAVELTPDRAVRSRRLVAAAAAQTATGALGLAEVMLDEAELELPDARERARARRVRGALHAAAGRTSETLAILLATATEVAPVDPPLAREALLDAFSAAIFSGARGGAVHDVAVAAVATPVPPGSPATSGDLLLDGLALLFTDGHAAAAPVLRAGVLSLEEGAGTTEDALRWLGFGCWAAGALGDNEAVRRLAGRLEGTARAQGALPALTRGLYFLAMAELVAGDLDEAASHFVEGQDFMTARGNSAALGDLLVLAWKGRAGEVRARAAIVADEASRRGQGGVAVYADHALAVLELALGDYDAARVHARRVFEEDSRFLSTVAVPDLVEAAVRAGDPDLARHAHRRGADRAQVNGTDLALGLRARSGALLAGDGDAEALHQEAVTRLGSTRATGHLARAHLLYGEWLRRRRRRSDAREQLRLAADRFSAIGAAAFVERAQGELRATGERARRRTVDTEHELTAQEAQVARLAAGGATNAEIATSLFISSSTVDYHLRKVFRKLGIGSRRQLRARMGTAGPSRGRR